MTGLITKRLRIYARRLKKQCIFYRSGTEPNIFLFAKDEEDQRSDRLRINFRGHQEYETRIKWLPLLPDSQFFDLSQEQERLERIS